MVRLLASLAVGWADGLTGGLSRSLWSLAEGRRPWASGGIRGRVSHVTTQHS